MKKNRRHPIIRGLLLLACLCFFETVFADNKENCLLIWYKNGGIVSFPLNEQPCLTFNTNQSKVNCVTQKQKISFSMNDVHKYTLDVHKDDVTAIDKISQQKGVLTKGNDIIHFTNFTPQIQVKVYTVNGTLILSHYINDKGELSISTSSWNNGVYIINVGNSIFKILKK